MLRINNYTTIEEYREQMKQARKDTEPGRIYFDGSPLGSGKSTRNAKHVQSYKSSRTLVKTHVAAAETLRTYEKAGVERVAAYPKLSRDNCELYAAAYKVQSLGMNVGAGVCTGCSYKGTCEYQRLIHKAEQAPHQILSHDRGRVRPVTLSSSKLIIIEEDATNFLRPKFDASSGFGTVMAIASLAISDATNMEQRQACEQIHRVAVDYQNLLQSQAKAQELGVPIPILKPDGLEKLLCDCLPRHISGFALKIVLGAVFGGWNRIVLTSDDLPDNDRARRESDSRILTVGATELPEDAAVWITDATGSYSQLSSILPGIENRTPQAKIQLQHSIQQVPVDVCKHSSKVADVSKLLKRLLTQYCQGERVGLITHREFLPDTLDLTDDERSQIVMSSYFGAGDVIGSNNWYVACDKLVILGTPRPAPRDVKSRAIQVAQSDSCHVRKAMSFGPYTWKGETADGRKAKIVALGYKDEGWKLTAQEFVQGQLNQAAGRGRGFLKDGIPVILVTTEPMGCPLLELPQRPKKLQPVFEAIWDGLDNVSDICQRTGQSESTVKRHVVELKERGEIFRESKRRRILISPPAPPT